MKWPELHNGDRIRILAAAHDGAYVKGHIGIVRDCEHRNFPIVTFRGEPRLHCAVDPMYVERVMCPHYQVVEVVDR